MQEFKIRPYSKSQLARMYFPDLCSNSACRRLSRWITRCKPLCDELSKTHYDIHSRWYTPNQVRSIVDHLGEP